VLKRKKLRRTVGISLVIAGGLLMWLAPAPAFSPLSAVGILVLLGGIVLEAVGITLEHRDHRAKR
jgi:drug/metabolite transporter (DMT)-like permease